MFTPSISTPLYTLPLILFLVDSFIWNLNSLMTLLAFLHHHTKTSCLMPQNTILPGIPPLRYHSRLTISMYFLLLRASIIETHLELSINPLPSKLRPQPYPSPVFCVLSRMPCISPFRVLPPFSLTPLLPPPSQVLPPFPRWRSRLLSIRLPHIPNLHTAESALLLFLLPAMSIYRHKGV